MAGVSMVAMQIHTFANDKHVRLQVVQLGETARSTADGVGFINDEQRAVLSTQGLRFGPIALIRMNDTNVGHGGFSQNAGHIAILQGILQRLQVVEFDDFGGARRVSLRTHIARTRYGFARLLIQHDKGFVDGTVITPVVHQHVLALGNVTRQTQGEAIRIGGRHSDLPIGQAKAALQLLTYKHGIFTRQHEGNTFTHTLLDGVQGFWRSVAGQSAGITTWRELYGH